jgi:hypothetical protein
MRRGVAALIRANQLRRSFNHRHRRRRDQPPFADGEMVTLHASLAGRCMAWEPARCAAVIFSP